MFQSLIRLLRPRRRLEDVDEAYRAISDYWTFIAEARGDGVPVRPSSSPVPSTGNWSHR